jgi:murein DD-endopeptidase MepM/ murein hydrolase activator NlpD
LLLILPISTFAKDDFISTRRANVSLEFRSQKPGESFLVKVRSDEKLKSVKGKVFEGNLTFYMEGNNTNVSYGIGGIRLGTKPGRYPLELNVTYKDGSTEGILLFLNIEEKEFDLQELTLDKSYVNLSASNLERVKREKNELNNIFDSITTEKLFFSNFGMPLTKNITSTIFGLRRLINGEKRKPHTGLDLRGAEGTPVHASNRGRIALTADLFFTGKTIIIDHGLGIYSFYAHLSKIFVEKGNLVKKGELVGHIGSTGRVTGPHLHWTVKIGKTSVDPVSLLHLNFAKD